ncbi:chemotaxis protein CheD [Methanoregula sp.]|uniref:chemotaxis protein CheD n=1 Tax=Methanoregula sp. TaxID=2052170 RepID=UPI002CC8EA8A|nr:chemotaxis protein CheD [Methanoregula sp.]HVP96155.1 chemotaxis protein CheD [Methanoregula sp.]
MSDPALPTKTPVMIGIGEFYVGSDPMMTIGLGSCIGLTFYDRDLHIGAMVHIMLPDSSGRTDRPGKYADTAVPLLIQKLTERGSQRTSIVAKMAGGACMFEYFGTNLNIGERNAERVRAILSELHIRLTAEEVGGKTGRTVAFYPGEGGKVTVRSADGAAHEI